MTMETSRVNTGWGVTRSTPDRYGFNFIIVCSIQVNGLRCICEKLRVKAKDQVRVDAIPAVATNLRSQIVECVEMIQDEVKCSFGDILPLVLIKGLSN